MRRAFTLIELLVVVSILALLAAILFPVFGRARENARRSNCLSNTRQISLAILQYAQDNDDFLPPVAYETASGVAVTWPQLVTPYLKNEQIFKCPSDTASVRYSYGLNELAFVDWQDDPTDPPIHLARFRSTSETVMLGDVGLNDDGDPDALKMVEPGDDLDDDLDALPVGRHFDRTSLVFMDGHAKSLKLEQFYSGQTPADKFFAP
jgi:prepilin-type N-terminal cleavage/methylation domain-containing protein